jgi:DNA/RNA-binding domain of Phe-tRNA-synthetase-like protein
MSEERSDAAGAAAGEAAVGWIAEEIAAEFPDLRLRYLELPAVTGRSPQGIRDRLAHLSNRFRGAQAIAMRQDPVPWAYRVFYRHVGLDPDVERTPIEAAVVRRLIEGSFKSHNLLDDALTLSLVETGVPIWALDAERCEGAPGIRAAEGAERLGSAPNAAALPRGRLVVADDARPLAVLFGEIAPGHGVTSHSRRMLLFSIQVAGVSELHVEEALWQCLEVLAEAEE